MDAKTKGAWIIHHLDKLQEVTATADYENIVVAGKMGLLLSALSVSDDSALSIEQVNALATGVGVSPKLELPSLLDRLEDRKLIDRAEKGIEVLGITSSTVLSHTTEAFDSLQPSDYEEAALSFADSASMTPLDNKDAAERLGDDHKLSKKQVSDFLVQSVDIGFVDAEEIDSNRKLYFNGNLFRRQEARKIEAVLSSLKTEEVKKVQEFDELLKTKGCLPLESAHKIIGLSLFEKAHAIGMYDVSAMENDLESVPYVTKPSAFHKFIDPLCDDALHLAKALVASLTYGMTRSTAARGRITLLPFLLKKLIAGRLVGPAEAIGQDYRYLEMRRVVEIRQAGTNFYLKLLKMDVGKIALQVLTEGQATDAALSSLQGASVTRFAKPEESRMRTRKKQAPMSKAKTKEILMSLRTS